MKRREFLIGAGAFTLVGRAASMPEARNYLFGGARNATNSELREMRGPFPIMSTPYFDDGQVDYETLGKACQFVADCGCPGVIWCQSNDAIDLLTYEEKVKGFEACAAALEGRNITLTLGCNGADANTMLALARAVEACAAKHPATRIAIASRPPDNGKTQKDIEDYYVALARVARRPVIIQTYVNKTCPAPEVKLLISLARRFPSVFGYIKEESEGLKANDRMAAEIAARPTIHTVFSAWGGWQWLYQSRQIGSEGLITERCAYADLLSAIWKRMENGDADGKLDQAYGLFMSFLNLEKTIPGNGLRGYSLEILRQRGVFKNCVSRDYKVKDKPGEWKLHTQQITEKQSAEIVARLAALKRFLKEIDG